MARAIRIRASCIRGLLGVRGRADPSAGRAGARTVVALRGACAIARGGGFLPLIHVDAKVLEASFRRLGVYGFFSRQAAAFSCLPRSSYIRMSARRAFAPPTCSGASFSQWARCSSASAYFF